MTQLGAEHGRRRCCECRAWYTPKPSAAKGQKTCGRECRLRRRARQERARRLGKLASAQADERERQRRHRARKCKESGTAPPVSLTGLSAQLGDAVEEIVRNVGQEQRLSLTGLRRRLRRMALKAQGGIERGAESLGQGLPVSLTGLHP